MKIYFISMDRITNEGRVVSLDRIDCENLFSAVRYIGDCKQITAFSCLLATDLKPEDIRNLLVGADNPKVSVFVAEIVPTNWAGYRTHVKKWIKEKSGNCLHPVESRPRGVV